MEKMNPELSRHRLTVLANFLDTIPKAAFNIESWLDVGGDRMIQPDNQLVDGDSIKAGVTPEQMISCGTAACAAGWAATIPEFRVAGLKLLTPNSDATWNLLAFGEYRYFEAAAKFFGIFEFEAEYFFDGQQYLTNEGGENTAEDYSDVTPDMVAERIRAWLG